MKCPTCGTESDSKFCPGCGTPTATEEQQSNSNVMGKDISSKRKPPKAKKPLHKKWWFWVIIVIFSIGIISNLGGNAEPSDDPTDSDSIAVNSQTDDTTNSNETATPEDQSGEEDLSNIATEYTLTAGYYVAGIDFPAGKCNVTAISGTGNLISSNMFSGGVNTMFGIDDGTGFYSQSFNGLSLPKDTTLSLNNQLTVKLEFTKIDSNFTGRTYDETAAITLTNGNYEAGVDFPAGNYNIVAVSGKGNLSSTNMYDGGLNEMFGVDDSTGLYNNQFLNAALDEGTTLSVSGVMGGLTIKIIPQK